MNINRKGQWKTKKIEIFWDMTIQCDHAIKGRRPYIVVVEKENNQATIVDIAPPWDHGVYLKEGEKKYLYLKREFGRL